MALKRTSCTLEYRDVKLTLFGSFFWEDGQINFQTDTINVHDSLENIIELFSEDQLSHLDQKASEELAIEHRAYYQDLTTEQRRESFGEWAKKYEHENF